MQCKSFILLVFSSDFQMLSRPVRHSYNLQSDPLNKSTTRLAPSSIPVLSTLSPRRISHPRGDFCICPSVLPAPCTFLTLNRPLWPPSVCSLCLCICFCYVCSFILCFWIPQISETMWHLSFWVWRTSLSTGPSALSQTVRCPLRG